MLGDYVEHSRYGIGKVIRVKCGTELVYFFKADEELHDGAIEHGACEDYHGWWFESEGIKNMRISHLRFLIEKRRESKKIWICIDYVPYRKEKK